MSVDRLADVLVHQRDEERERALRALLMQPLLPSSDPAYALVRRHTEYLRDWLARECGWPLLLESGVLARVAGDEDAWVGRGTSSDAEADVLYDVHRRVLALLPASSRGASLIEATAAPHDLEARLAALGEEFVAEGEGGLRAA